MGEPSASGREAGFLNVRTVTWHGGSYGSRAAFAAMLASRPVERSLRGLIRERARAPSPRFAIWIARSPQGVTALTFSTSRNIRNVCTFQPSSQPDSSRRR
jgi:hypothetical protein